MKKKSHPFLKIYVIIFSLILLPVCIITIGYSAMSSVLSIDGKSLVKPIDFIIVMSINPEQETAVNNVSSTHNYNTIEVSADLPTLSDESKYKVVIKNLGQSKEVLSK